MSFLDWLEQSFDRERDSVVITGATSGIGYEYLRLVARAKCRCIIISNEADRLQKVADEVGGAFETEIIPIYCDLSNYEDVCALEGKLKNYRIKMLINNAGFGLKGDFLRQSRTSFRDILAVNSLAPTLLSHMVLPQMREMRCGVIIFVTTINVATPIPMNSVYTASKFYTWAFSLALSEENREYGIHFQVMLPGTTDTPFHVKQGAKPAALTMAPDEVARRSLNHIDSLIFIPNRVDRAVFPLMSRLPIRFRMRLASFILKKRLGI